MISYLALSSGWSLRLWLSGEHFSDPSRLSRDLQLTRRHTTDLAIADDLHSCNVVARSLGQLAHYH